jgi:hypothetical protein
MDSARVTNAVISGHALVEDNAKVYGSAKVRDWGHVFGYAEVFESGKVIEHGNCGDGNATTHTKVYGNAIVKGTTYVYDTSTFNGCLIMDGDSANGNGTTATSTGVHFGWGWGQDVARFNSLSNNAYLYAQHTFETNNPVFAMDQFGINHGFLMNGCRSDKDTNAPTRGGLVLPLNGVNQYVELHNGVNDFRDSTYAVWFKQTGSAPDQCLWSFGNGASKAMYLTPNSDASGGLRFTITDGATTLTLDGGSPAANTWHHAAIVFSGATCTLYVDGVAVASNPAMTLFPDSLNAPLMENANYLGRGNAGNFFQGCLDDFRAYMKALSAAEVAALYSAAAPATVTILADTNAPTPNPATWLVTPRAISDNAVTMSATPGTDASGWVEYYFACTSGAGHDSGWVSFNKYNDVGVTPGSALAYTVKMRDRNGNTTIASAPASVTCQTVPLPAATFAYGPIGIANGQITMTATKPTNLTSKIEYKFDRTSPTAASSGWQSSPKWTQTGLTTGVSYAYTVTMRDGWGNISTASAAATAVARDDAAPIMPTPVAHWHMLPYATIDNKVSMTANSPTDASGVEYLFHCVSGGGPDSAWQSSTNFVTSALADGTYVYQYQVRDTSAQRNTSGYSTSYTAKITPTTGYHTYTLSQVLTNQDDYLVSFPATVMKVFANNYYVKDLATGLTVKVRPSTSNEVTDAALALKNGTVKGHLYTFAGVREITFATVTATGNPTLYTISGKVTNSLGVGISGATVYFADVPGASTNAIFTATTDASGNYSRGVTSGNWYVAAGASAYNTSSDRLLTVSTAGISGINFGLVGNAKVTGKVTRRSDSTAVASASVYFSRSAGASASPAFTATTDASGNYTQSVQDGIWYVCAGATGFYTCSDKTLSVNGADVGGINFALQNSTRTIPKTTNLLFSVITESLPASGNTGNWPTYQPAGGSLTTIGSPTVEMLGGVKWEKNVADGPGYRQGTYSAPIPINGASIVVAAKPKRTPSNNWDSIVDIFYDRLVFGIRNDNGQINVRRNGSLNFSSASIPDGQTTILSLVVQPNGQYKVWANGLPIYTNTSTSAMTALTNGVAGGYANAINVGRNDPDGWTTFNGNIGDIFVYTNALADADRIALEADLTSKFLTTDYTVTVTSGAGGYVNPMGTVLINPGGSQTFSITPLTGYSVTNVVVDGFSRGATNSWTFSNVTANHTLSAVFALLPPPTLAIARNGSGGVEITWPANYPGALLWSPVLGTGAAWQPVGLMPEVANGQNKVVVTPGAGVVFYGLGR